VFSCGIVVGFTGSPERQRRIEELERSLLRSAGKEPPDETA
jgi:hypothetical protein